MQIKKKSRGGKLRLLWRWEIFLAKNLKWVVIGLVSEFSSSIDNAMQCSASIWLYPTPIFSNAKKVHLDYVTQPCDIRQKAFITFSQMDYYFKWSNSHMSDITWFHHRPKTHWNIILRIINMLSHCTQY